MKFLNLEILGIIFWTFFAGLVGRGGGRWRWLDIYFGWVGVTGHFWVGMGGGIFLVSGGQWTFIMVGWGWVEVYCRWVGVCGHFRWVGRGEWGWSLVLV